MTEETLFARALEQSDAAARAAFLEEACAGDPALRAQVEALLRAHEAAGAFLRRPAVEQVAALWSLAAEETLSLRAPARGSAEDTPGLPPADVAAPATASAAADLVFLAPPTRADTLGRLGPYEVQRVIGRGGMGVVLQAVDEVLQRVVALKVLAPPLAASSRARQQFLREARAAAAVTHDHVVTIHAVAEEKGFPYLVLQYIPGESLQQKLERDGRLGLADVLRIGQQTAAGLAAAHARGLVHCDVKPTNLLLEEGSDRVRITDFGVARAAGEASTSRTKVIVGTPAYMSPEQASGADLDHRSDLFSLGSVLYTLCAGVPPFQAENTAAVLERVRAAEPRPLRELNPDVPPWLAEVIRRLHAKDPAARFQTAAEVAELFARQRAQAPLAEGPRSPAADTIATDAEPTGVTVLPQARRALPRRRLRRGLLAATALLLAAGGAATVWLSRPGSSPAVVQEDPVADEAAEFPGLVPQPGRLPGGRRWQLDLARARQHIAALAWSPDGQALACGDAGGALRLLDVTGERLRLGRLVLGHQRALSRVAWSPSGQLASASHDQTVRVWEADGRLVAVLRGHTAQVDDVAWGPDEHHLVSSSHDLTVRLWDVRTGQAQVLHQDAHPVRFLAWSPDGRYLAGAVQQTVRLWGADGRPHASFEHGHFLRALAWAPDGRRLASSGLDLKVRLWRPDRPGPDAVLDIPAQLLAWHPDGAHLAAVAPKQRAEVHLWQLDGTPRGRLCAVSAEAIECLAWSPDGTRLGLGCTGGRVVVWQRDGTRELAPLPPACRNPSVAWSPDGDRLATGCPPALWAGDGSGQQRVGPASAYSLNGWSADGQGVLVHDADTDRLRLCSPTGAAGPDCPVPGAAVPSPDGRRFMILTDKHREFQVVGLDGQPGPRAPAGPRASFTSGAAWDPAGQRLAITQLGLAFLWDVDRETRLRLIADVGVESVGAPAWSPDGQWLAVSNGTRILLHRADGTPQRLWRTPASQLAALAWSPDSRWLAAVGDDCAVRLWQPDGEPGSFQAGPRLYGHRLAWSRDGRLATLTGDGTLAVWDMAEGKLRLQWMGLLIGDRSVAFNAHGFLHGDADLIEEEFVYVVETATGAQELLSPAAFRRRREP